MHAIDWKMRFWNPRALVFEYMEFVLLSIVVVQKNNPCDLLNLFVLLTTYTIIF